MSNQENIKAPWQATFFSILFSQAGLAFTQYLAYKQEGGIIVTCFLASLQAIQGSVAAYGLRPWQAARGFVTSVGDAVGKAKGNDNGSGSDSK